MRLWAATGSGLELDRWIQAGDLVKLEAQDIGVLRNPVGHKQPRPPGAPSVDSPGRRARDTP